MTVRGHASAFYACLLSSPSSKRLINSVQILERYVERKKEGTKSASVVFGVDFWLLDVSWVALSNKRHSATPLQNDAYSYTYLQCEVDLGLADYRRK